MALDLHLILCEVFVRGWLCGSELGSAQ